MAETQIPVNRITIMQARNEGGSYQVVVEDGNGQILEIFCK